MANNELYNDIANIKAYAQVLAEMATRIMDDIRKEEVVSTPSDSFRQKMSEVLAKRQNHYKKITAKAGPLDGIQ